MPLERILFREDASVGGNVFKMFSIRQIHLRLSIPVEHDHEVSMNTSFMATFERVARFGNTSLYLICRDNDIMSG